MPQIRATPEKWSHGDVLALNSMQELAPGYVPWTFWSMRPSAVASVVNEIILKPRRSVVELGAGASTLLLAAAVRRVGGRLVSIEHDADFCASLNRLLEQYGLSEQAVVEHVPLSPLPETSTADGGGYLHASVWYDVDTLTEATPSLIDLLVVDGPPAGGEDDVLVREPAVRVLRKKFGPSFSVYLDDLDRGPERETLRLWEELLQIPFTCVERISLGMGSTDGGFAPTL